MVTDLSTLLARVEAGSGADRAVDWELHVLDGLDGVGMYGAHPSYTTDLNAVIGLVEARLPGWAWLVRTAEAKGAYAHVTSPEWTATWVVAGGADEAWQQNGAHGEAYAPTPARALLAALLRAEMEKVK